MKRLLTFPWIGVLCLFIAFTLSACGLAANRDIPLSLKEANVNEVIQTAVSEQNLPFRVNNVDMKNGFIRVSMAYRQEDGADLNGSYDVALQVDNGQLTAEITNVDMPGLILDQQILDQIAELITRDFVFAGSRIQGQVEISSLLINEEGMEMLIRVNR